MEVTPILLSRLAELVGATREGREDPLIAGAAGFAEAGPGQITFVDDRKLEKKLAETAAAAVVLRPGVECPVPCLRVENPRFAFAQLLRRFAPSLDRIFPAGVHPTAVVDPEAELGDGVRVGPGAVIGAGVAIGAGTSIGAQAVIDPDARIGERCLIYARAVVRERCVVGDEAILYPGCVIGSDGFGYVPGPEGLAKIPQIGIVVLEDRVEIGANACVDRAQTGETRIKAGTKIDNLVQIGHNVTVGANCALSAQTGVSGSCVLGDWVTMGGQVGCADHLNVGDGVKVGAKSGLSRDVPAGQTVFGIPAVEFAKAFKIVALSHRLPEFAKRLQKLEAAFEQDRRAGTE